MSRAKKGPNARHLRRAAKRKEYRLLTSHLTLHGYFPVAYDIIGHVDGGGLQIGRAGAVLELLKKYESKDSAAWPLMPQLRKFAAVVGGGVKP